MPCVHKEWRRCKISWIAGAYLISIEQQESNSRGETTAKQYRKQRWAVHGFKVFEMLHRRQQLGKLPTLTEQRRRWFACIRHCALRPKGMYQPVVHLPRENYNENLHPPVPGQSIALSCATTAIFSSETAVPSLPQDFLWYFIGKHNVTASASAVAYNRPTEYVCVGVAESRLGPGADHRHTADDNGDPWTYSTSLYNKATTSTSTQSKERSQ